MATAPLMDDSVSIQRLEGFLRLLSHDVRNDLNAIDLLSAYLQEITAEQEVREELTQVRASVRFAVDRMVRVARALQAIDVEWVPYPLGALMEDLSVRVKVSFPEVSERMEWSGFELESSVRVDGDLVFEALLELISNAAAFSNSNSRLRISAQLEKMVGVVRIGQIAEGTEGDSGEWGRSPFKSKRRGHYGIGLFRARRILEALGASLEFRQGTEEGVFWTEVAFSFEEEEA